MADYERGEDEQAYIDEGGGQLAERRRTAEPYEPSGEVLAGISSGIVGLYREHFGKGPTKAKTYALDDLVICVLRDGLTTVERTLFLNGRADSVREMRSAFQEAVSHRFTGIIEELTGRQVLAFMSQAHVDPDLAIEVFFLDGTFAEDGILETDGDWDREASSDG